MAIDLSPGNRKYRIAFERATEGRDAMNAVTETWSVIGERWAAISFATGQERRTAAQEAASAAATFGVVRDEITRTLTVRDRIKYDAMAWDISSRVPAGDLNEGYEITGTARVDLQTDIPIIRLLSGGVTGSATLYAQLGLARSLSGQISGGGALQGTLSTGLTLTGAVEGVGSASGTLNGMKALVGSVGGQGQTSGSLTAIANLAGALAGSGSLAGTLAQSKTLAGGVTGAGSSAGVITITASYDTDAQAYFTAAGVTDTTEKDQINAFIVGAKADGFWAKLDRLGIFAATTSTIALRDVRNPVKAYSVVNSPTFTTSRGYTGDGSTSYIDSNEAPSASGNLFALNSATIGYWINAGGANSLTRYPLTTANGTARIASKNAQPGFFQINDGTSDNLPAALRIGHRTAVREGASIKRGYYNGSLAADLTSASTSIATGNLTALNNTTDQVAAVYCGSALTSSDLASIHTRLNTLLTLRGAN